MARIKRVKKRKRKSRSQRAVRADITEQQKRRVVRSKQKDATQQPGFNRW